MKTFMLSTCVLALSSLVLVQMGTSADARSRPKKRGIGVVTAPNSTGNRPTRTISRGATAADTITNNSAAGGNAGRPEQAVPNSSAGGSNR
ncbi:hypothetical protein ASG60_09420 [Methylobacterium sp. Leaf469]|uniref:hypothetical protein n=1 Tax=Methylobacterium sp. Leaf469 TaxID=1736387 RepID=UPI0006FF8A7D|nr:hypothetical protein [Methylobacterium sp. Leaf469]KQT89877.1 hypothetical protein ASG60_09420 [Methylobacterium sp. Leaf469]